MKAKCKFCSWTKRASGAWDAHYASRDHLRITHPAAWTRLEALEDQAHAIHAVMIAQFGQASKRHL